MLTYRQVRDILKDIPPEIENNPMIIHDEQYGDTPIRLAEESTFIFEADYEDN